MITRFVRYLKTRYLDYKYSNIQKIASENLSSDKKRKLSHNQKTINVKPTVIKKEFDVPLLIDKTIDEIRVIIGNPDDEQLEPAKSQGDYFKKNWLNTFRSPDYSHDYYIDIYFNSKTWQVNYIYLSNCNGDVKIVFENLLIVGKLSKICASYIIEESMAGKNHDILIGIQIFKH